MIECKICFEEEGSISCIRPAHRQVQVAPNGTKGGIFPMANPKQRFGDKKVAMGATCPVADIHESMAMMEGDWKYGWRNFRDSKVEAMTYVHAALRHIQSWAEGEEVADDSGVHHLGHARACLGILLDAQANGNLIDNRKPGVFGKVLKQMENWVAKRRKYYEDKENEKANKLTNLPTAGATIKPTTDHIKEVDRVYEYYQEANTVW